MKVYSKDQFEEARLDAYEVTIPRLLNQIKSMEAALLEVRQDLNVCLIQMMTGATPDFGRLTAVMNALNKLTPRE